MLSDLVRKVHEKIFEAKPNRYHTCKIITILSICIFMQSCSLFGNPHTSHPYNNNRNDFDSEWMVSSAVFDKCSKMNNYGAKKNLKIDGYQYIKGNKKSFDLNKNSVVIRSAVQDVLAMSPNSYQIEFTEEEWPNVILFGHFYSTSPFSSWRNHGAISWTVSLEPYEDGTNMNVWIGAASKEKCVDISRSSDALFNLFFDRVNYLLGREEKWTTCEEQHAQIASGKVDGDITPLCSSKGDVSPPLAWEPSQPPGFSIMHFR